jgi:hypothetical protein
MSPAVPRPRRETLPLLDDEWDWKSFERFSLRFVRAQSDVVTANLYGKRGEKQKGIDITATLTDGRTRTYQCRRYKRFTPEQAKKTVEEHGFEGDEHVILIACEASAALRDWERNKACWSVQDAEDLSAAIRDSFARQFARELVEDTFGPDVRRTFLGPPGPLAFLSPQRYFAPYLQPGRLLHHRATLFGRAEELARLRAASAHRGVVLLPGAGGAGKTRLLREFADAPEMDGVTILLATEAVELAAELVDDLPRDPLCVVVDDAHRRDDLRPLLAHARRAESPVTLVLAARPPEVERIEADARHVGFDGTEITCLAPLAPLATAALQEIAQELVGDSGPHARELAEASDRSPLLCVIGGELLARHGIPPAALRATEEFREEVLGRYSDELLGRIGDQIEPAVARGLLQALSALGPLSVENDELIAGLADMLGTNAPTVVAALGELQAAGLVAAGGRLRRVTPDVLADRLFAEAALDRNGEPTGYVDALYTRFGQPYLEPLLKNGAMLDWQVRRGSGRLLDGLWRALTVEFDRSGAFDRSHLVERLRAVARGLQPTRRAARRAAANRLSARGRGASADRGREPVQRLELEVLDPGRRRGPARGADARGEGQRVRGRRPDAQRLPDHGGLYPA